MSYHCRVVTPNASRRRGTASLGRSNGSVSPAEVREAALTLFAERGYHGTSMKDIAAVLGIRAPSLYNHLESKQALLQDIILETMDSIIREQDAVLATSDDVTEQLRRIMEAHARFHTRHSREVRINNSQFPHLEEPAQTRVRELRRCYARPWISLIERGVAEGRFETPSPRLSAYAMLQMGIGVSLWFRANGPLSESQVAYYYGDMALRLVHARPAAHASASSSGCDQ